MVFYSIKLKNSLKKTNDYWKQFYFLNCFRIFFGVFFVIWNEKFEKKPASVCQTPCNNNNNALVFWVGLTDWHRWWFSPDPGKKLVQEQFDESLRGFELTQGNIFARLTCKMASWACHHWTTADGNKYLFYLGLIVIIKKAYFLS